METRERIFEFDTTAGVDNLKNLRAEIKELKAALEELEIGSDNYREVSAKLAEEQYRLNEIMGAQRDAVKAQKPVIQDAEGSFNALNAQLRELKVQWKATGDEMERAALTEQINAVKGQMNAMNESIGNFQHNVGNYTNSIIDAFQKMGISVTSLTAPLKKIGVDIESMDTGIKVISGTLKTFSGQNLQALQQMLVAATASTKGFILSLGGIQKAILATGIGALVVMIGVLIAKWDDWFGVTEAERNALENTKIAIRELNDELTDQERLLSYHVEMKKLQGATDLEVLQYENEELHKLKELAQAKADEIWQNMLLMTSEDDLAEARKNHSKAMDEVNKYSAKIQQNYLNQSLAIERKRKEARDKAKEQAKKNAEEEKKYIDALVKKEQEKVDKIIDKDRERMQSAWDLQAELERARMSEREQENFDYYQKKKLLKDYGLSTENLEKEHQKNLADIRHTAAMEDLAFEEEMRQKKLEAKIADEEKSRLASGGEAALSDWDYDAIVERNNAEFDAAKALNDSKIALNQELMLSYQETSEEYQRLLQENELLAADTATKQAQRDRDNADAYNKLMKQRAEATKSMVSSTSSFLKQASQAMGENTKAAKGFAVASATIDTIAAAIAGFKAGYNQWKDAPGPLAALAPIQGAINAAAALAAGYAQVQKIMSVDPSGSNAGGASGATAMAIPNIEGLNSPMDYTRQVTTETEKEEMNSPQRVYILESDIQESGNRVRVREEETTF